MKATHLIIVLLLAAVVYLLGVNKEARTIVDKTFETQPRGVSVPTKRTSEPQLPPRTSWTKEDLTQVHGFVVGKGPEGVQVFCSLPFPHSLDPGKNNSLLEGAKGGVPDPEEIREQLRQSAVRHEDIFYGPVMVREGNVLRQAGSVPRTSVRGRIVLVGHPSESKLGMHAKVNVVAVPVTKGVYTMVFNVPVEHDGSWKWNVRKSPLDRR